MDNKGFVYIMINVSMPSRPMGHFQNNSPFSSPSALVSPYFTLGFLRIGFEVL